MKQGLSRTTFCIKLPMWRRWGPLLICAIKVPLKKVANCSETERSGCVAIHVYWREQYKVWLLPFIYIHIYIALGWWFFKNGTVLSLATPMTDILFSCDSRERFLREPHKSREWSGPL